MGRSAKGCLEPKPRRKPLTEKSLDPSEVLFLLQTSVFLSTKWYNNHLFVRVAISSKMIPYVYSDWAKIECTLGVLGFLTFCPQRRMDHSVGSKTELPTCQSKV